MAGKLPGRALASTANLTLQTISVGNSTVNTVINSTSISAAGGARFAGHLMPAANVTYDIGNSAMRWRDLWLSGTTINLGGATIKTDTDTGAIAFVPKSTAEVPNPKAVVVSPRGGIQAVDTTDGVPVINNSIVAVDGISYGNSTVNTAINSTSVSTVTLNVGSNVFVNTSTIHLGNSTVNTVIHTTGFTGNGAGLHSVNAAALEGNTVANILTAANTAANTLADAAYSNAVSYANNTFLPLAGGTLTGAITVGNSTVNSVVNSTAASLGNTTINGTLNVTNTVNAYLTSVGTYFAGGSSSLVRRLTFATSTSVNHGDTHTLNAGSTTGQIILQTSGLERLRANSAGVQVNGPLATGNTTVTGDLIVSGNVFFNGTTTNVNSTNLVVEDKNIIVGDVATPTDITADGGGITLKGTTDKTLTWVDSTDAWTSSEDFNLVSGKSYEINGTVVVNSTSLGTGITGSSLTSVGTLTTLAAGNTTITGLINVSTNTATFGTAAYVVANGNVGIGTSTPAAKVNILVGAGGANGIPGLRIGGTDNYASLELGITGGYDGMITSYGNDIRYYAGHWRTAGATASENHSHYWHTSKSGSTNWDTAKMALNHEGYLGIGATSPYATIHIAGDSNANGSAWISSSKGASVSHIHHGTNGDWYIRSAHANSGKVLIQDSGPGYVGIGTSSPNSKLHIVTGSSDADGFNLETTGSSGKTFFAVHKLGFIRVRSSDTNGAAVHYWDNAGTKRAEMGIGSDSKMTWYSDALAASWITLDHGNGRVGIGNTAPASKLTVSGNTSSSLPVIDIIASGSGTFQRGVRMINSGMASGNHIMYAVGQADNSKNMGQFYFYYDSSGSNSNRISIGLHSVDDIINILGTGNVGIGTTAPGAYRLYVSGDQYVSGTLTEASSIALKENIDPISNALDSISKLVGVTYDRKDGSAKQRAGLIAEEVDKVLPNVVQKDSNGTPSGIQYTNLIAYLVESIKQLKAEIDLLKSK